MFLGVGGGGGGNILSIDNYNNAGTSVTHNGLEFFYSNNTPATTSENRIVFTANPGSFYVAMIGAAGGTGGSSYALIKSMGGNGGIGIAKITISTQTQYTLVIGGGGLYHETTSAQRSCVGGGLANAASTGAYKASGGGGGLVALLDGTPTAPTCSGSSWSTYSQSDVIVCVGSGGGGGYNSGSIRYSWQGQGGGFDQVGLPTSPGAMHGYGGTLTTGGTKGSETSYGTSNTDGSACLGGDGCTNTSLYDNGAGGGAGWYGGGGGSGGGGYSGGSGGGGSGKINDSTAAIANDGSGNDYTDNGAVNTYDPNSQLETWIQTVSGESFVIPSSSYGMGDVNPNNTHSGWVCIWTAPD